MADCYLLLNEATLPQLLWRALLGKPTTLVAVEAYLPRLQNALMRLAIALASRNIRFHQSGLLHYHAEQAGFASVLEGWISQYFDFAKHAGLAVYGYAYKKACHKYVTRRGNLIHTIHGIAEQLKTQPLIGVDADLMQLYSASFNNSLTATPIPALVERICAFTLLGFTLIGGLAAIVRRLRLKIIARPCFLAADRLMDARDGKVIEEVHLRGKTVLYVARTPDVRAKLQAVGIADYRIVDRGSGRIPLTAFWSIFSDFLIDWVRLVRIAWRFHPRMAFELSSLAYQRILIRADLITYPCQYFYARDEYNSEHVVRTYELRRIGAKSLGLMHGTPILGRDAFAWSYVSFDIFFVSGSWIIDEFQNRWPSDMDVRAVGCFGLTRELLHTIPPVERRPGDILVFISWVPNLDLVEEMIDSLCLGFPDRTIRLKVKATWRDQEALERLRSRVIRHPNLVDTTELSLDLMAQGRCVVTTPSTVVSEALQAGLPVLCIDDGSWGRTLCYRRFPLVVATAAELMARAEAILEQKSDYPFSALSAIVAMDGTNFDDAFLAALALREDQKTSLPAP